MTTQEGDWSASFGFVSLSFDKIFSGANAKKKRGGPGKERPPILSHGFARRETKPLPKIGVEEWRGKKEWQEKKEQGCNQRERPWRDQQAQRNDARGCNTMQNAKENISAWKGDISSDTD